MTLSLLLKARWRYILWQDLFFLEKNRYQAIKQNANLSDQFGFSNQSVNSVLITLVMWSVTVRRSYLASLVAESAGRLRLAAIISWRFFPPVYSFSFLFIAIHNGKLVCVQAANTLICQDIMFSVSSTRKGIGWCVHEKLVSCMCMRFVQMKRWNFTVTSALQSGVVVCDTNFNQKDYLPFTCMIIIYSLSLLKTSISRHISLAGRAGTNRGSVRWH